jgi:peptidoglycan/LPS O-acetylase OafA/YrhL
MVTHVGLKHRRDIDGLRAIAILSVLGYHAFAVAVPGGFIGVDVFFVISGYLISSIIFTGLQSGRFSFIDFYSRRIRRIFPALAVVLVVALAVGWYALLPDEFAQLAKHVAAGAGFIANIALFREAGYFDRAAELKPLLHLWSLGVEEQFYLFWPLLLFLAWRIRLKISLLILAVGLASFVFNVSRVRGHELATFYLPASRLWELLCGSWLAYAGGTSVSEVSGDDESARAPQRQTPRGKTLGLAARNLQSFSGIALIAIAAFGLNRTMPYPGWWALLPTVGTCLLISAGEAGWINRVVLSNRTMVFIGLISYPLYLWHWPLLSFERIVDPDQMTTSVRIALIALAFVLAWATYRLIELPIRFNARKKAATLTMAILVACIGIVGYLGDRGHLRPHSAQFGLEKMVAAASAQAFPGPNLRPLEGQWQGLLRQGSNPSTVVFIGDSFLEQYYPRIDRVLQEDPTGTRSVVYASSGGCPPLPGVIEIHHAMCSGLLDRATAYAAQPNVDAIVIGANWASYFLSEERDLRYEYSIATAAGHSERLDQPSGSAQALALFSAMISNFRAEGKSVYLILPSPYAPQFDPRRMVMRRWGDMSFRVNAPVAVRSEVVDAMEPIASELRRVAQATGAKLIDPLDTLCGGRGCPGVLPDGVPIYKDGAHLNPAYVRSHVMFLDGVLRNAGSQQFPQATPEGP